MLFLDLTVIFIQYGSYFDVFKLLRQSSTLLAFLRIKTIISDFFSETLCYAKSTCSVSFNDNLMRFCSDSLQKVWGHVIRPFWYKKKIRRECVVIWSLKWCESDIGEKKQQAYSWHNLSVYRLTIYLCYFSVAVCVIFVLDDMINDCRNKKNYHKKMPIFYIEKVKSDAVVLVLWVL